MTDDLKYPAHLSSGFHWLMLARIVIVTFLLGMAIFIQLIGMESQSAISVSTLINLIVLTYLLSLGFLILPKYLTNIALNIYLQSLCDIILVTAMIHATGGIGSIYSIFYPLIVIYSVIFLGRNGGWIIATAAGMCYGVFAILEFMGVITPFIADPISSLPLSASYVFTRIVTHVISFYLLVFLASYVVEQERKTRTLLLERQGAFEQLDILHRSIIESVDTGILTLNLAGQIKSFNRAASEITGLSFSDVENRTLSEILLLPPPIESESEKNGGRTGTLKRFETAFLTKEGRQLVLGGSVSTLRDPTGLLIGNIIVFQDLTVINEMKESLDKSRRLAFIGEMAAGLAHEIRNPLASISGSIQMLREDLANNEINNRLMQIILRGKDQLEGFLKDFLLMARPAPGFPEVIDVGVAIREVLESLRCIPEWSEQIEAVPHIFNEPLQIKANKTEIRQVLWNLLLNAIQAMPEGGLLTIDAYPVEEEGDALIEIRIADTGFGIGEEQIKKIFEPFYTTRDSGTGLGLAVVNRIVENYGGSIYVESELRKGTAFTLRIPVDAAIQKIGSRQCKGGSDGQDPRGG